MYSEGKNIYDLIYRSKNYKKESEYIKNTILEKIPNCKTLLNVACGTGEHDKYLKDTFQIDGIDINETFLEIARKKNASCSYHYANMEDFDLKKTYDVILCLFSSLSYVVTYKKMERTLQLFYKHLNSGGLLIVEPWLVPEAWQEGQIQMKNFEEEDIKICRLAYGSSGKGTSITHYSYLVGVTGKGVDYFKEVHTHGLFTVDEMIQAFTNAHFTVEYSEQLPTARGLYYGIKK